MLVSFAVSMLAGGSVVKVTHGFAKPPRALSFRASVTTTEQNLTPLHRAAYNGHPAVQRTPAQNMCAECDLLLEHLRRLDVPEDLFNAIPPHRITRLRRQGERYFADGLRELPGQPPPRDSRGLRRWKPTTGSSAERIAKPPVPAKRSSGTRRPRSAGRSGHSPSWGGR